MVQINKDACKGCGICIAMCPVKILEFSDELNNRGVHFPRINDEEKYASAFWRQVRLASRNLKNR